MRALWASTGYLRRLPTSTTIPTIRSSTFDRSAKNPAEVSNFVQAYIAGAHSDRKNPVLVTAKHFPGHGDTTEDSHMHWRGWTPIASELNRSSCSRSAPPSRPAWTLS